MELVIKVKRKHTFREILESYRDLPEYKYALLDIYLVIKGVFPQTKRYDYLPDANDSFMLSEIMDEIKLLRAGLDKPKDDAENGGNTSK